MDHDELLDLPLREILKLAAEGKEAKDILAEIRATLGFEVGRPAPVKPRAVKAGRQYPRCRGCGKEDETVKWRRCGECRSPKGLKKLDVPAQPQAAATDANGVVSAAWVAEFKSRYGSDSKFAALPGAVETARMIAAGAKPPLKSLSAELRKMKLSGILASVKG